MDAEDGGGGTRQFITIRISRSLHYYTRIVYCNIIYINIKQINTNKHLHCSRQPPEDANPYTNKYSKTSTGRNEG